jgi:hypothetical protein
MFTPPAKADYGRVVKTALARDRPEPTAIAAATRAILLQFHTAM